MNSKKAKLLRKYCKTKKLPYQKVKAFFLSNEAEKQQAFMKEIKEIAKTASLQA